LRMRINRKNISLLILLRIFFKTILAYNSICSYFMISNQSINQYIMVYSDRMRIYIILQYNPSTVSTVSTVSSHDNDNESQVARNPYLFNIEANPKHFYRIEERTRKKDSTVSHTYKKYKYSGERRMLPLIHLFQEPDV